LSLSAIWVASEVSDEDVAVSEELLRFADGDATRAELVESLLGREELMDNVGHVPIVPVFADRPARQWAIDLPRKLALRSARAAPTCETARTSTDSGVSRVRVQRSVFDASTPVAAPPNIDERKRRPSS